MGLSSALQLLLRRLLPFGLVAAALAGCAAHGKLDREAAADLLRQDRTIVLLRLTADNDGRPFDAISSLDGIKAYRLSLVDLGSERQETLGPRFPAPDAQARRAGWVWFAVQPGDYFLQLSPPWGAATERQERSWADNRYRMSVADGGRVQYAGSFHVHCRSSWGLFGARVGDCPGPLLFSDESALARELSVQAFGTAADFVPAPLRPYGELPSAVEIAGTLPFRIAAGGGSPWQPPDWERLRRHSSAPAPGSGVGGGGGLGGCYGPGCGGLALIALVIWAGVEVVDEARDQETRARWEPCTETLARALPEMEIADRLRRQVAEMAGRHGGGGEIRGLLQLDLRRVHLRKCAAPESVCVEVAARARLTDLRTGETVYEATPIYTSADAVPTRGFPPRPYGTAPLPHHLNWETPTPATAPCYGYDAICGPEGLERFRAELDKGLQAIAAAVAGDLHLGGGDGR